MRAVPLYRGRFLEGFRPTDSDELDGWVLAQQERLRDLALAALEALVEHHARHGEHAHALYRARHLVELDPLSERAHRRLLRLYVEGGQRERALAHFESLREELRRRLGSEPMEETRSLGSTLRGTAGAAGGDGEVRSRLAPLVPLVGRDAALERLAESCAAALGAAPRLALVDGATGSGTTRLVHTALDRAVAIHGATVLRGRASHLAGLLPYAALRRLLDSLPPRSGDLPGEDDLATLTAGTDGGPRERLAAALTERLEGLIRPLPLLPRVPLILFLDDLRRWDPGSRDVLTAVVRALGSQPLWLVAARRADHPLDPPELAAALGGRLDTVRVGPLERSDLAAAAAGLVPADDAARLARFLQRAGGAVPVRLAELVQGLWQQRILERDGARGWSLAAPLPPAPTGTFDELVVERLRALPYSTVELLSLAAVFGPSFEVDLLTEVADEHPGVVEIALELAIERGLVRRVPHQWRERPGPRDLLLVVGWGAPRPGRLLPPRPARGDLRAPRRRRAVRPAPARRRNARGSHRGRRGPPAGAARPPLAGRRRARRGPTPPAGVRRTGPGAGGPLDGGGLPPGRGGGHPCRRGDRGAGGPPLAIDSGVRKALSSESPEV